MSDPDSWRQDVKDAANGDLSSADKVTVRMVVAVARRGERLERKLDRVITLLITTSISFSIAAAGWWAAAVF